MDNTIATMKNILMGCAVAVTLSATLASCADDLDMFADPNALRIEVVDQWTAEPGTRVAYSDGGMHTEFEEGDAIGVYVFDGTEYKYSNVKFTMLGDGTWTGATVMKYNPNYTYFAYYPYVDNPTYTPTTGADDDIDTRFATFIADESNVFWKSDQSTKANFDQSNLMISKGETTVIPRVRFVMNHKRGLAVIGGGETKKNVGTYALDTVEYKMTITNLPNAYQSTEQTGTFFYLVKPETDASLDGMTININRGMYKTYDKVHLDDNTTYQYSTLATDGTDTWSEYGTDKPSWLSQFNKVTQDDGACYFELKTDPEIQTYTNSDGLYNGNGDDACVNYESAPPKAVDAVLSGRDLAADVDLSMVDNAGKAQSKRNTSNCYLVHAPGSYKLPLVYGNAITNGETNSSAYHTDTVNSFILNTLLNHADKGITDPWIENNKGTDDNNIDVKGATLVWEDMKGMISHVGISSGTDGKYLTFTVDKDHIAEGNAVVGATLADGTIVWTWHIWVTKQTMETTSEATAGDYTYKIANVNLGAVHAKFSKKCKIKAEDSQGVAVSLDVENQLWTGIDAQHSVVNTYYQCGLPVAVPPFESSNLYDGNGSLFTSTISSLKYWESTIGMAIQNPGVLYNLFVSLGYEGAHSPTSTNLCYYNKKNLWNMKVSKGTSGGYTPNKGISLPDAGVSEVQTTKTIYDPCPPGFSLPPAQLTCYYSYQDYTGSKDDVGDGDFEFEVVVNGITCKFNYKKNGLSGVNLSFSPNIFMPASGAKYSPIFDDASGRRGRNMIWSYGSLMGRNTLSTIGVKYFIFSLASGGTIYDGMYYGAFSVRPIVEQRTSNQ